MYAIGERVVLISEASELIANTTYWYPNYLGVCNGNIYVADLSRDVYESRILVLYGDWSSKQIRM